MSYTLVLEWMPGDLYMSAVTARCTAPTSSYSVVWLPPNKVYQITLYCGSTSLVSFLVGAFRGKAWSYMKKYQCPCCGYFTYNVPANEDCGYICPVCFWENDPFIASDNEPSDSNHGITLKEAKSNFSKFGACEKEMLCYVRSPRDDEKEIS